MKFSLEFIITMLERMPDILETLLKDLPEEIIMSNEGPDTWSPYDITGHLIHGEKTDWIKRLEIILSDDDKKFKPFDRFAQFSESKGKTITELLTEFKTLRVKNILILKSKNISQKELTRTGIHPDFGTVTMENLLATWMVHDFDHISQISRVIAYQYKSNVGPWKKYLRLLQTS